MKNQRTSQGLQTDREDSITSTNKLLPLRVSWYRQMAKLFWVAVSLPIVFHFLSLLPPKLYSPYLPASSFLLFKWSVSRIRRLTTFFPLLVHLCLTFILPAPKLASSPTQFPPHSPLPSVTLLSHLNTLICVLSHSTYSILTCLFPFLLLPPSFSCVTFFSSLIKLSPPSLYHLPSFHPLQSPRINKILRQPWWKQLYSYDSLYDNNNYYYHHYHHCYYNYY